MRMNYILFDDIPITTRYKLTSFLPVLSVVSGSMLTFLARYSSAVGSAAPSLPPHPPPQPSSHPTARRRVVSTPDVSPGLTTVQLVL